MKLLGGTFRHHMHLDDGLCIRVSRLTKRRVAALAPFQIPKSNIIIYCDVSYMYHGPSFGNFTK